MTLFASGNVALAICDICGQTVPYLSLKKVVNFRRPTGILACPDCWSGDQPQNFIGELRVNDAFALKDSRPDTNVQECRSFFGWNPLSSYMMELQGEVGTIEVVIT
jgi:hypothetical protein